MANKTHPLIHGLFSFDGRMRRSEYWITNFGLGIFKAVLGVVLAAATGQLGTKDGGWASGVIELLFLWPTLAVMVKRGHDRDRSIWLSIGVFLIGVVAVIVTSASQLSDANTVAFAGLVVTVGCIGFLLIDYGFIDGTQGPNRYGPSPKGVGPQHREQDIATVFE
jgi:uncharacterized membrane protein YhaH (DUF805 family)